MDIKIFVNNAWQENTIILYDGTGEAVVIDCGCSSLSERETFKKFILDNGLKPVLYLNTHLHIDHIFGNAFMKSEYGLLSRAHRDDSFWVENGEEYAKMLGVSLKEPLPELGEHIKDGEIITFGNSELRAIHVPGHSPGSLCFYSESDRLLIAGDVLFEGSIGRADLPGGDLQQLLRGIAEKLFTLPDDTVVIPGHGDMTMIGREKITNPFFKR